MPLLGKRKRAYKPKYVKRRGTKRITGRYRARAYFRKRRSGNRSIGRYGQAGIPDKILHKFNYVAEYAVTATDPAAGFYQWRLNSINDPDFTGTGHQAMDHDSLMGTGSTGLWSKYIVYGCKVRITFINRSSNPCRVLLRTQCHTEALSATDDFDALSEQAGTFQMIIPSKDAAGRYPTYKRYFSIKKIEGVRTLDYTNYEALYNGNPSYGPKLNLWTRAILSESHNTDLNLLVRITYYAKLFQRNIRVVTD